MQSEESIPLASFVPGSAAARLLDAAVVVFSREGIRSATTREIAKEAGVNEVTLFRNFQTKQGLLTAVIQRAFLPAPEPEPESASGGSLEEAVRAFAVADFEQKRRNISMLRVLIGESHRLGEHETAVVSGILRPWKEKLANRIQEGRDAGQVREDADPLMVVDQLVAMVFIGALKAEKMCTHYSPEQYLESCVEMVLLSILVERSVKSRK